MMKRETKRRIAYYQDALPDMKKRVFAAALMLMIAVIVSITATYAWVTLSVAPVVSSVNTTMSANGALEIALSPDDGSQPQEYDIDESIAVSTDDVTVSNLRWGNLINLSDSAYGIDKMILRPARLNTEGNLAENPLVSAIYGADGRTHENLGGTFVYAKMKNGDFLSTDEYGVRVVGTPTEIISAETSQEYEDKKARVEAAQNAVNDAYEPVSERMSYNPTPVERDKGSISNLISAYVASYIPADFGGKGQQEFAAKDLRAAYELCQILLDTMHKYQDALVELANFQLYVSGSKEELDWADISKKETKVENGKNVTYYPYDAAEESNNGEVSLVGLKDFIADLAAVEEYVQLLGEYCEESEAETLNVYWSKFLDANGNAVNRGKTLGTIFAGILDYDNMTIKIEGEHKSFKEITGNISTYALKLAGMDGESTEVVIKSGILKDFEQMAVDEAYPPRMTSEPTAENPAKLIVKVPDVPIYGTITITGYCKTDAKGASDFQKSFSDSKEKPQVANDTAVDNTYGMAVDFWLRTNAEEAYLTLEGATVVDSETKQVLSYDGVNRVWGSTDKALVTTNSTTQGGGSCYTFYAEPENMTNTLDLLQHMRIAFIDKEGDPLAEVRMDTDNKHAVNGRVTVPLVIVDDTGVDYPVDGGGEETTTYPAITKLTHDNPQWITAIIYLDGDYIRNQHVLAAADIDGQLNIQFGSSEDLDTLGDSKLEADERIVTATVTPTHIAYDDSNKTATVTVNVEGTEPRTVTAFFIREINATQGERQEKMAFHENNGEWVVEHEFRTPGTYHLRHVHVNGVEYELETPLSVVVDGFAIKSITINASEKVYSPANYYEVPVEVMFASSNEADMPKTVEARFVEVDVQTVMVNSEEKTVITEKPKTVTTELVYNPSTAAWSGTAVFQNSGTYQLRYLLLDKKHTAVREDENSTDYLFTLSLGLKVIVYNDNCTLEDQYDAAGYLKKVKVEIKNETGELMRDLEGVNMYYRRNGSVVNGMHSSLTWNSSDNTYNGDMKLINPGEYTFDRVEVEGVTGSLTRALEAPAYKIISDKQPSYVGGESESIQYDLFPVAYNPSNPNSTADVAFIGPINIKDSGSAEMAITLKNDKRSGETFTVYNGANGAIVESGTLPDDVTQWKIMLPRYDRDASETGEDWSRQGEWTVEQIALWGFYDEAGNKVDSQKPYIWTMDDYDFDDLTTEVRCDFTVSMIPTKETDMVSSDKKTVSLGGSDSAFMANNYVKDLGISVQLFDYKGEQIKFAESDAVPTVKLNIKHNNKNSANYGYTVSKSVGTYSFAMTQTDVAKWILADTNANWRYVGEYEVQGLTVEKTPERSKTFTYDGDNGIPAMYTVTSAAPGEENLRIKFISQNSGVYTFGGKVSTVNGKETITREGTFLDTVNPNVAVEMYLVDSSDTRAEFAVLSGLDAKLVATYVTDSTHPNGYSEEYGGYTWTGSTNPLTEISLAMNPGDGERYESASSPMLAGKYSLKLNVTLNNESVATDVTLEDISVFSKSPTVKVTGVSPKKGTTYQTNLYTGENVQYYELGEYVEVQSFYSDYLANVYIEAKTTTAQYSDPPVAIVDYTLPKVTLELSGIGLNFAKAEASITSSVSGSSVTNRFEFAPSNLSSGPVEIGMVDGTATFEVPAGTGSLFGSTQYEDSPYERRYWVGEQVIDAIMVTDKTDASIIYQMQLEHPVTIREMNEAMPSISYASAEGYDLPIPETQVSKDGDAFKVILPASVETVMREYNETDDDVDWVQTGDPKSEGKMYYKVSNPPITPTPSGGGVCGGSETFSAECTFTYYKYTRTVVVYEKTSVTETKLGYFGVVKWNIGGNLYSPGDEVVISGTVTAIPEVGVVGSPTVIDSDEKTFVKEVTTDIYVGEEISQKQSVTKQASGEEATENLLAKHDENGVKPANYSWFDPYDHTKDGHLLTPRETEYEKE